MEKYKNVDTNFKKLGAKRKTSFCKQFTSIFVRNLQYLTRNPRSVNALMFSGTFSALLDLALFFQIGKIDPNWNNNQYTAWIFNMKGFSLMIANSIQFSSSSSVIL